MPVEGLWWADDLSAFESNDRSQWLWTMMAAPDQWKTVIRQPMALPGR